MSARLAPARMTSAALTATMFVLVLATARAQEQPRFAVASIKPSADNLPGMVIQPRPAGTYSARKVPLMALLTSAYGFSPERIVGAPRWEDRYDIEARAEASTPGGAPTPTHLLLQSLLRDRFGLVAHLQQLEFPVYVLRVASRDGRLGPRLRPSSVNCGDLAAADQARTGKVAAANGAPACGAIERPDAFITGGMTMDVIASALRIPAGRPVINGTGLVGTFEAALEFAPLRDTVGDRPNVFTAVQEQLGLRLEPSSAPLDVLVITEIHRPTAD